MVQTIEAPAVDLENLRKAIQDEYALVADEPEHGGGRLQIGDIPVQKAVPRSAKQDIALWTG